MTRTISALYNDVSSARSVVETLVAEGIDRDNISLVANDTSGKYASYINTDKTDNVDKDVHSGEGASFGAVVGALVGFGAMLIPGIGPVIAAGPLVAGLVGAGVGAAAGAVTGGITASLVKMGIDEETAGYYAEGVRRGGTLVVAHVEDRWNDKALEVMKDYNPIDVKTSAEEWRSTGWKGFDASNTDYTSTYPAASRQTTGNMTNGMHTFAEYDSTFRRHYQSTYGNSGNSYDYYSPAYQYGYGLATDERYRDYDWQRVESDARTRWEENNKDTWDKVKDAVRNAWDSVREAVS